MPPVFLAPRSKAPWIKRAPRSNAPSVQTTLPVSYSMYSVNYVIIVTGLAADRPSTFSCMIRKAGPMARKSSLVSVSVSVRSWLLDQVSWWHHLFTPRGSNREDVMNVDACLRKATAHYLCLAHATSYWNVSSSTVSRLKSRNCLVPNKPGSREIAALVNRLQH